MSVFAVTAKNRQIGLFRCIYLEKYFVFRDETEHLSWILPLTAYLYPKNN